MGVVFTDNITNDTGTFKVGPIMIIAELPHGKQGTAVNRFQAVPNIG